MKSKPKIKAGVRIRKDLRGYVVYFSGLVFTANQLSYDILRLCDGNRRVKEISNS